MTKQEDSLASHRKSWKHIGLNKRMFMTRRHFEYFHNLYMRGDTQERHTRAAQAINLISVLPFGTSPIPVCLPLQHPKAGEAVPGLGAWRAGRRQNAHHLCQQLYKKARIWPEINRVNEHH